MTSPVTDGSACLEEVINQNVQEEREVESPEEAEALLAEIKSVVSDNMKLLSNLFVLQNNIAQKRCVPCHRGHEGLKKILNDHYSDSDSDDEDSDEMEVASSSEAQSQVSSNDEEEDKESVDGKSSIRLEVAKGIDPERFIAGIRGELMLLPEISVVQRLQGILICVKAEKHKLQDLEKKIDSLFVMRCEGCVKEREESAKERFSKFVI